ncbi:aminoglycoside phosphotransferase family protein [Nocardia alni]|uniref:aminoglycoside phosphotransferase family protein n=1 Tax=Nocardia alni TaxID=2815723 RepID=UPI001C240310|nr:aminoglycoside phosphotransferase family protein [Nocardia alni]
MTTNTDTRAFMDEVTKAHNDNAARVTEFHEIPPTYDALTTEWLTAVLCRNTPRAAVTGFDLGPRDDGSSNRRRVTVTYNEAGTRAGLPASIFCKAAEKLENRVILGILDVARAEAEFYRNVRHKLDIEVPKTWYAGFDPTSYAYLIVMEDLGETARFPDERTTLTRAQAEDMVGLLAGLHSRFYASPDLGGPELPFKTWPDFWTTLTSTPGFPEACDAGFVKAQPVLSDRLFARRAEIWPATQKSVDRHAELPQTLLHSDVHFRNWYIRDDGRMGLTDWQIATIGHWSRDFVYAMTTALTVEQRREWLPDLLHHYLDLMTHKGVAGLSFDEAMLNIRQQLFTSLAFWTITLVPTDDMAPMQREELTFEMLRRIGAAIDDYDALDAF